MLICLAAVALLCGCEAQTRYAVLSFFFDGVPPPEDRSSGQTLAPAEESGGNSPKRGGATQHGPFAAKMCSACHDPNTNALLLPKTDLCLKCHILQTGRRQHGPVAAGGCLVCHDPHRSSNRYLLVAPAREFCMYCHDPNDVYARDAHRDNTVSCTECHNPHGSDKEYFLR
jgi:predicted CXXCH cytochrome family protein